MKLCVHGETTLSRPENCPRCMELAWALGLIEERPSTVQQSGRVTE